MKKHIFKYFIFGTPLNNFSVLVIIKFLLDMTVINLHLLLY